MKLSAAALLAAAAGVSATYVVDKNVTYTTEVVTALTTYCPESTTLTHAGTTYTITEATTLTITNCPCTVTKPLSIASSVICHACTANTEPPVATEPPVSPSGPPAPPPFGNATSSVPHTNTTTTTSESTPPSTPTSPAATTGVVTAGAAQGVALSGASLAGALGLAALFL